MKYHSWTPAGREWDTSAINLWKCKHCGIYKALSEPGRGQRTIEFSTPDGEVLMTGKGASGPRCVRGGDDD